MRPGAIVHVTGEPSAGKTTLANALADRLRCAGRRAEVLDGDALRRTVFPELGFSGEDRDRAVSRAHELARLLARNGVVAIVAMVSPRDRARQEVGDAARAAGLGFLLVHVWAGDEARADRMADRVGGNLEAARALGREMAGIGGYAYEVPRRADFTVCTDGSSKLVSTTWADVLATHLGVR